MARGTNDEEVLLLSERCAEHLGRPVAAGNSRSASYTPEKQVNRAWASLTHSERSFCRRMPATRVNSLYSPSFSFTLGTGFIGIWAQQASWRQVRNERALCTILHPCLNSQCVAKAIWPLAGNVCVEKLTPKALPGGPVLQWHCNESLSSHYNYGAVIFDRLSTASWFKSSAQYKNIKAYSIFTILLKILKICFPGFCLLYFVLFFCT